MVWAGEIGEGYRILFEAHKECEVKGIQKVEIYKTKFGKMLVIDDCIQLIEKFEKTYHEMLVHVPMFTHENPKEVLIIGGGDGCTLREVLKHEPDRVVMVEIDKNVIELCRKCLKIENGAFEDKRVELRIEDGIEYVKNCKEEFDVLIVDGTDPSPTSISLFSEEFFQSCSKISDVFCMQSQSPAFQEEYVKLIAKNTSFFKNRAFYLSCIPMYPGGIWSFVIASNSIDVRPNYNKLKDEFEKRKIETEHYSPEVHLSAFVLPKWISELVD